MKKELLNQYHAGLQMLNVTIERCPDELWIDDTYSNVYWRIVYHTLYYTALYGGGGLKNFNRFEHHRPDLHMLGECNHEGEKIETGKPYTRLEMLGYSQLVSESLDIAIAVGIDQPHDMDWMPLQGLELHLYNLRHLQHHTGQLVERLHSKNISGIAWLG